jgi:hypothetical protein
MIATKQRTLVYQHTIYSTTPSLRAGLDKRWSWIARMENRPGNLRGWRLSALVSAVGGLWFDWFAIALYFNRLRMLYRNRTTMTVFFYSIK